MAETVADRYSSEGAQQELSNEYQQQGLYGLKKYSVLWTKVTSALELISLILWLLHGG